MKKLIRLLTLGVFAGFLFTACEGPMGPAGADGKDGKDGMNGKDGLNGVDANSSCLNCHTTAKWAALEDQYHMSKHFTGNTVARNTKWCARCHTHDGFVEVTTQAKYFPSNDIPMAVRINCKTCHAHSTFDFGDDTISKILAVNEPVALHYDNTAKTTDFGSINNLCATCHQIRGITADSYIDSTGAVKKYNALPFFPFNKAGQDDQAQVNYQVGQGFSVHDGNQSNLFAGINGYEYAGQTYTRTWKHSSFKCTDCHMNEYNATTNTGGPPLKVNEEKCTACHGGDKFTPVTALIDAKRVELAELLVARKVFKKTTNSSGVVSYSAVQTHDFYGTLFPTTESTTKFATATASGNTVSASAIPRCSQVYTGGG